MALSTGNPTEPNRQSCPRHEYWWVQISQRPNKPMLGRRLRRANRTFLERSYLWDRDAPLYGNHQSRLLRQSPKSRKVQPKQIGYFLSNDNVNCNILFKCSTSANINNRNARFSRKQKPIVNNLAINNLLCFINNYRNFASLYLSPNL
mgnify:CR=1 FL=1